MKRAILFLLVLVTLAALVSCAGNETPRETTETESGTAETPESKEGGVSEMQTKNGITFFTVSDKVKKSTEIRAELIPGEKTGEAGIFVGYENEDSLFGYTGYLVTLKDDYVTFYIVSSAMKEIGSARVSGLKSGKNCTVGMKLNGQSCGAYLYDDAEGVEPWPEIELEVNDCEDFAIGFASVGKEEVKCGSFDVTYPEEPKKGDTYRNPVMPHFADPDIWYEDGTYYLYGTGGEGYQVYTSKDLVNWKSAGTCAQFGLWNIPNRYWAPDVEKIGDKYYMVCSCNENLGIAWSDSPTGPFVPVHDKITYPKSIDGHLFVDDDGAIYLYFVSWDNRAYGIYGVRLGEDMTPKGIPQLIVKPTEPWEKNMSNVTEGPYMLKHNGTYYITYSGSDYKSEFYAVGYATSSKPLGSFTRCEENPIMIGNSQVHGTGHHCFVTLPDGTLMIVYHRHNTLTEVQERKICIDRARFAPGTGKLDRLEVYGPTVTPQPYPLPKSK